VYHCVSTERVIGTRLIISALARLSRLLRSTLISSGLPVLTVNRSDVKEAHHRSVLEVDPEEGGTVPSRCCCASARCSKFPWRSSCGAWMLALTSHEMLNQLSRRDNGSGAAEPMKLDGLILTTTPAPTHHHRW
jgi:hypothetical protein